MTKANRNQDRFDRAEAKKWLQKEDDDKNKNDDYDKALDKLFDKEEYKNKEDFIKNAENLIGIKTHDNKLDEKELDTLKAYKKSTNSHKKNNDKPHTSNTHTRSVFENEETNDSSKSNNKNPNSTSVFSPTNLENDTIITSTAPTPPVSLENGKGIVGLTSSSKESDTLNYPSGIQAGDNAVLTLSYSTDHTNIDIEKLKADGWDIQFKKGASNGKTVFDENDGDLVTLVATKKMGGNESNTPYTIPTKDGKNDVSAQMTVIRGGNIDMSKMSFNAEDGDNKNTKLASNDSNAGYYMYIASADDPTNYLESNLSFDPEYFGGTSHGDDAGATFISKSGSGGNIGFNYSGGGGRNDHSLSIPIVFEQ
jgi:hypothetical protein